jgi:hypothetical protein
MAVEIKVNKFKIANSIFVFNETDNRSFLQKHCNYSEIPKNFTLILKSAALRTRKLFLF